MTRPDAQPIQVGQYLGAPQARRRMVVGIADTVVAPGELRLHLPAPIGEVRTAFHGRRARLFHEFRKLGARDFCTADGIRVSNRDRGDRLLIGRQGFGHAPGQPLRVFRTHDERAARRNDDKLGTGFAVSDDDGLRRCGCGVQQHAGEDRKPQACGVGCRSVVQGCQGHGARCRPIF